MNTVIITPRTEFMRGAREALPVLLGFIPIGLVLGAQAAPQGLSTADIALMTALNFAGGSEFTAVHLWTSPPHILLIASMSLLVNIRHVMMGAALTPYLQHLPKRKALPALFFMCDEVWALSLADAQKQLKKTINLAHYMGVAIPLYVTWVLFTAIGSLIGPGLGDIERYGFGMAFVAIFLVILKGMWRGPRRAIPWLVSLVAAGGTHLLIEGTWYVAVGTVTGLVTAAILSRRP